MKKARRRGCTQCLCVGWSTGSFGNGNELLEQLLMSDHEVGSCYGKPDKEEEVRQSVF